MRRLRRPSVEQLEPALAGAARGIAARLSAAGHRAWIVGGAVRDLALGAAPSDVDMASAATPDEVERCFEWTQDVGRPFGTLLVRVSAKGPVVQHTTFRSEADYADARRPATVRFGSSVEEDAARRDFTCNALYLDPLVDEVRDPTGGLADLEKGRLRCVGVARERFEEDGLRLVRLARFAAQLGLEPDPEALAAARAAAPTLSRISVERVLQELERIFALGHPARAIELLAQCELLERVCAVDALRPTDLAPDEALTLRLSALTFLGSAPGLAAGLAVLLDPSPGDPLGRPGDFERAFAELERLRPARDTRREVGDLWRLEVATLALFAGALASRAQRVRLVRKPTWEQAAHVLGAWLAARGEDPSELRALAEFAASLTPAEREPEPLVTSADLERAGVPRGRAWGQLLEEAEERQIDGELTTRKDALAWLAARAGAG